MGGGKPEGGIGENYDESEVRFVLQTDGRNRNFIRTRKLLGDVRVLTAQQQFESATEAVSLFTSSLR